MMNQMLKKDQVVDLIKDGKKLILAGCETLLSQLPPGDWIGGSIPYFMGPKGGESTNESIFVTQLPDYVIGSTVRKYNDENIHSIYNDAPQNGLSIIIIPASSPTHLTFALNSTNYKGFATKPLIGWISGVHLNKLSVLKPKVFYGPHMEASENGAVVFNIELPENKVADIQIINIFNQGNGDTITFPADGFSAKEALINGEKVNFADYIEKNSIDTKLPLVNDAYGDSINISFQGIDEKERIVNFYAPVFTGTKYKIASPVENYTGNFVQNIPKSDPGDDVFFTCNCILNYLYADLEGKKTADFTGPITFGEIAYQLLNQTFVFATIKEV